MDSCDLLRLIGLRTSRPRVPPSLAPCQFCTNSHLPALQRILSISAEERRPWVGSCLLLLLWRWR